MSAQKIAQKFEVKFWELITPIMSNKGPLMKVKAFFYRTLHSKPGYLIVLMVVWGAVGFVAGLLIGRVIGFFPLA